MVFILRHGKRVSCAQCGSLHPAIYTGQACLICASTIEAVSEHRKDAGSMASGKHEAKKQRAQIAALQRERDRLSLVLAALVRQDGKSTPDYEWHVEMAAKGMAERDNHPMPKSVSTPKAFYEVMAGAALETIGLQALLERVARAELELENTKRCSDSVTSEGATI